MTAAEPMTGTGTSGRRPGGRAASRSAKERCLSACDSIDEMESDDTRSDMRKMIPADRE